MPSMFPKNDILSNILETADHTWRRRTKKQKIENTGVIYKKLDFISAQASELITNL